LKGLLPKPGFTLKKTKDEYEVIAEFAGDEKEKVVGSLKLVYLTAVAASVTSILLGYDVGVMSGAIIFISEDLGLTRPQQEIVIGSLNLIAAFGGLMAGKAADRLGRRWALGLACLVFLLGGIMMTAANDFQTMLAGRVVTGLGVGCGFVISPIYISEVAPASIRGKLVAITDIAINLGILAGYLACYFVDASVVGLWKWRLMLGLGMTPPSVILVILLYLPESPRWLVARQRNEEAYNVLQRITPPSEGDPKEMLQLIMFSQEDIKQATWSDTLFSKNPVVQRVMLVVIGLGFWQQANGSEAAVYYTPIVLQSSGVTSDSMLLLGTSLIGLVKLLGEIVGSMLIESYGRTYLLITSALGVTCSLIFITVVFALDTSAAVNLFGLCSFMWWFSIGIGPVTWVSASELLPVSMKGKAMSVCVFFNRVTSALCALSFLSLEDLLSLSGSFGFYGGLSVLAIMFYTFFVPETQGRSLEEIQDALSSGLL